MTDPGEYAASFDPAPGMDAVIAHWRMMQRQPLQKQPQLPPVSRTFRLGGVQIIQPIVNPAPEPSPEIVMPFSFMLSGQRSDEGLIIVSVAIAWDALLREIERDANFLYTLDPRKLEELVAARYDKAGWNVTLTPRSGDRGRDVIAVHQGLKVRIFDEVKCYAPGTTIDAGIVRSIYGVIALDRNVSKGIVTTTADFHRH